MRSFGVQVSNVQFLDWAELCHVVAGAARLLSESVQLESRDTGLL